MRAMEKKSADCRRNSSFPCLLTVRQAITYKRTSSRLFKNSSAHILRRLNLTECDIACLKVLSSALKSSTSKATIESSLPKLTRMLYLRSMNAASRARSQAKKLPTLRPPQFQKTPNYSTGLPQAVIMMIKLRILKMLVYKLIASLLKRRSLLCLMRAIIRFLMLKKKKTNLKTRRLVLMPSIQSCTLVAKKVIASISSSAVKLM